MNKSIKQLFSLTLLIVFSFEAFSQDKYWISFKDKDVNNYDYAKFLSPRAIQNRKNLNIPLYQFSDIPVKKEYVQKLQKMGIAPLATSRWFNSITASLTDEQLKQINKLPYVASVEPVNTRLKINSTNTKLDTRNYSLTLEQMKGSAFVQAGLSGKGVMVGVIDAGFYTADREPRLIHLFDEKKVKIQKDFINPERGDLIENSMTGSDDHGKKVLDYLSGYYISEKLQTGLGVNATLHLARTENGDREHRGEEDSWIQAMEWMDSLGVRLINTSLGYAINMDDPEDNYLQEDMNGKTTRITKAAQMAVDQKGMFVVVSAGNEGGNPSWKIISAPADAEGVLSVGATEAEQGSRIYYSSIGPEFLPYLKPNVATYSPNGTSFSAPAVTGFVSCIMERDSTLNAKQIKEIVEKSGTIYPYGNTFVGYGVPQADRVLKLIADPNAKFNSHEIKTDKDKVDLVFDTKKRKGKAVLFYKKDSRNVIKQSLVDVKRRRVSLARIAGIKATTVLFDDEVIEVIWE